MSEHTFRRVFLATLIGTAFTLSACSSLVREAAPAETSAAIGEGAAPVTTGIASDAIFAIEEIAADALPVALVPPPGPERFPDLLERIRAGYQLEDVDQKAIDQQLAWYANHPDYLERTFGRGERYLYYIVTQLEERNMPLELTLLPIVESAFEPFGYSRARASGLWQFIPGTGKRFGLKQNWWYDGRRDIVESTRAALDYLQFLHEEFNGDWLLAVAAYNSGEVNVHRAINRNLSLNKPTDFWHLKLPRETRAYVPKLLAMSRLVRDPQVLGIEFWSIANEPYFASVETGGQIDLKMAAELAGITVDEITHLNPAFNRWATDPDGPHQLLVPIESSEVFRESLGQVLPEERVRLDRHAVQSGDTLSTIARRYSVSVAVVKEINGLKGTQLRAGQDLLIPANGAALHPKVALAAARVDGRAPPVNRNSRTHVVRRGESLWTIARAHGVSVNSLASLNGMEPGDLLPAGRKIKVRGSSGASGAVVVAGNGEQMTYTVRRGDTLSHIARRFSVTVSQLLNWNGLSKHDQIMPGQRIVMFVMPRSGG
ncbi:MAG TPA: LysM peptidoglycan-binding domain-containing protein [Steroidobacteraceae bacterium]